MTLLVNDPMTQLAFSVHENKGVFALLLGSGLSRAADIPTGWQITIDLIQRVAAAQGIEEPPNWEKWYKDITGDEPNYSTLVEELASTAAERRSILHSYIEPNQDDREQGRKIPTRAHHAIAGLVRSGYVRLIVTTNFDRLIENALREAGVEPTIIVSTHALLGAEPITHSSCYLIKLHGDYKDTRILNTDCELSAYPPEYDRLLDRILDEYGLIVCGWSGEWDHALRAAILRAPNRRYATYWAARGELRQGAQDLINHRRARVIPNMDADSFFSGLRQRVETLEHSRRQNPLSIELLVNSAKRFLGGPEHRIQLNELLAQETDRLNQQLCDSAFDPQGADGQQFHATISKYEAATEPLGRMAGLLGRWGDDTAHSLAIDTIRTLHARAENAKNGIIDYDFMRAYPAVLVLTSYALGLVKSNRWAVLHATLRSELVLRRSKSSDVISEIYPETWRLCKCQYWEKSSKSGRPFSDHLFGLMSEWRKSFLAPCSAVELESLYGRFDILGAMAYAEKYDERDMQAYLSNPGRPMYVPLGRVGCDERLYRHLVDGMKSEILKIDLLSAGFAKRSATFFDLFLKNLDRVVESRW
jgi:hypothetical protein